MNYCARCKRYLNGALSCAGCGTMAGGSDDHPTLPLPKIRVQEMVPLAEPAEPKADVPGEPDVPGEMDVPGTGAGAAGGAAAGAEAAGVAGAEAAGAAEAVAEAVAGVEARPEAVAQVQPQQEERAQAQQEAEPGVRAEPVPEPEVGTVAPRQVRAQQPGGAKSEAQQGAAQRKAQQRKVQQQKVPVPQVVPNSPAADASVTQELAKIPASPPEPTSLPEPAADPATPSNPDFVASQVQAPVWVGASDAALKFLAESGQDPTAKAAAQQAPTSAQGPSAAADLEETQQSPISIPVPVPLSIPNDPPQATVTKASASATAAAKAAPTDSDADTDEYSESEVVGVGASGVTSHRADDERGSRGLSRKTTGVLVGTAAVVAVVAGAVVFSSSPSSPKASTPPSQTGLVVLPTMDATGPQIVTDKNSGSGQSAAPNLNTTAPTASASARPTAQVIVAPSATQTPLPPPNKSVATTAPPTASPFSITASKYSSMNNIGTEPTTDNGGGQDVGWITNGSWLAYSGTDFATGLTGKVEVRLASLLTTANVGTIQFRLNSPNAQPFATISVNGTGGWQNWTTAGTTESPIPSGTYTLYVTFSTGTGGDFVNVNWFQFS